MVAFSRQSQPYYTREEIADILRECGFKATFYEEEGCFPIIISGVVGHRFTVTMSGKSIENNHDNIMKIAYFELSAVADTTPRKVNEWNLNYNIIGARNLVTAACDLYGEKKVGFVDASLTMILEHTSPANIAIQIGIWDKQVSDILKKCSFER
jgi:hypothetical protein